MTKRKTSEYTPDPSNANTGTERGLRALDDSLAKYGAGRSILVDKNGYVIAGNKTLERAVDLGIEDVIEVENDGHSLVAVRRTDLDLLSDPKARELAYADNRVGQLDLEFNVEQILADLNAGVDLSSMWREDELTELLASILPADVPTDPGAQVDKASELQQKWGVARGDLWQIGAHKLLCGDSTNADDVARVMAGERAQGVFTSPPYAEQRKEQYGGIPADEYVDWWEAIQANSRAHMTDDASFFLNIKPNCEDAERVLYVFDLVLAMKRRWGWAYIDEYCWLRAGVPKMVKYRFKNAFEPIYQFAIDARKFKFRPQSVMHYSDRIPVAGGAGVGNTNWAGKQGHTASDLQGVTGSIFGGDEIAEGMAYPSNVLKAWTNTEALGHAAAFPPELPEFFMLAYSDEGDIWFDPFMGSGTVFVAAEQNKRRACGIEYMPEHCSIILERMAGLGLEPKRVE